MPLWLSKRLTSVCFSLQSSRIRQSRWRWSREPAAGWWCGTHLPRPTTSNCSTSCAITEKTSRRWVSKLLHVSLLIQTSKLMTSPSGLCCPECFSGIHLSQHSAVLAGPVPGLPGQGQISGCPRCQFLLHGNPVCLEPTRRLDLQWGWVMFSSSKHGSHKRHPCRIYLPCLLSL